MVTLRFILLNILLLVSSNMFSQNYIVYTVSGKATYKHNGMTKPITAKLILEAGDVIDIQKDAKVVILNKSAKSLCTIKTEIKGSVDTVLKEKSVSVRQVSDQYMSFMTKKTSSQDKSKSAYMQSAATSYRGSDSILCNYPDSITIKTDSKQ